MTILQLAPLGEESVGLVLPQEVLARLNWKVGDTVLLTELEKGISLSSPDSEFEHQVAIGRKLMREHWAVLRALATSDTTPDPR